MTTAEATANTRQDIVKVGAPHPPSLGRSVSSPIIDPRPRLVDFHKQPEIDPEMNPID